jgi:hypothetical protein
MRVFALKEPGMYKWQPAVVTRILQNTSVSFSYCVQYEKNYETKNFKSSDNAQSKSEDEDNDDDCESDDEIVELQSTFLAYGEPIDQVFILPVRTRIVTLYENENESNAPFYSVGTISEIPNIRNRNR